LEKQQSVQDDRRKEKLSGWC